MNRRIISYIVLNAIIALAVLWSPSAASSRNTPVIPLSVRAAYLKLDFSDIIADSDKFYIGDSEYKGAWRSADICANNLSLRERLMLSTVRIKDTKASISPAYTSQYVRLFRSNFGTMPRDGVDLLLMASPGYLSQDGWKEFCAMTRTQQAVVVQMAVNPATGKIYDSFTKAGRQPFSFRFKKLIGKDSIRRAPVPVYSKETESSAFEERELQAWECTVYGEKKGRIILKHTLWHIMGGNDESPKPVKGCGCSSKK
jgi:hypothetical protein